MSNSGMNDYCKRTIPYRLDLLTPPLPPGTHSSRGGSCPVARCSACLPPRIRNRGLAGKSITHEIEEFILFNSNSLRRWISEWHPIGRYGGMERGTSVPSLLI